MEQIKIHEKDLDSANKEIEEIKEKLLKLKEIWCECGGLVGFRSDGTNINLQKGQKCEFCKDLKKVGLKECLKEGKL